MHPSRVCFIGLALTLALGGMAVADTIHIGSTPRTGAQIRSYRNGTFEYTLDGRPVDPIAGSRVTYITLDDDPTLTAAEQAFAQEKWVQAAEGYQAALKATKRPWLKDWALPRMLLAADRGGRFDLAVSGFVQMLPRDPWQAMKRRPRPGDSTPASALAAAAAELTNASRAATLPATQKLALQSLLVDVQRLQGDLPAASRLSEQLLKSAVVDKADPASASVVAEIYLTSARLAVTQKDYARVIALVEPQKALFTDPPQQIEALYCLAVARDARDTRDARVGASPSREALQDLAIEYMRVVAVSRALGDRRYLPEALERVGELQEQLGDSVTAATLYAEVAGEYKDSPAAARATARAAALQQRLKEKSGT